ncbi:MAG: hypothetical protein AAGC55_20260 [Myxococcota bacterium]
MKTPPLVVIAATMAIAIGDAGCSCSGANLERPYGAPTADKLVGDLVAAKQRARSYRIESVMDYWVGDKRVKGTVLLMGTVGARVRINALNPTGDNVAADLACDGISFQLIDYNGNCQRTGPCTRSSIAQLLRVDLEPDDFLLLAMGGTPLIAGAYAESEWDSKDGHEILKLIAPDNSQSQTVVLSGRHCEGAPGGADCPWAVVSSVLRDARGNEVWNLRNRDFRAVTGADGALFRVPEKTQFKQPAVEADLLVRWREQELNPQLDNSKFTMTIPPGLALCP